MDVEGGSRSRRWFWGLPPDLTAVALCTIAAAFVELTPIFRGTLIQAGAGLLLFFVLPGYSLVAALFPFGRAGRRTSRPDTVDPSTSDRRFRIWDSDASIPRGKRIVFSIAGSLVIVPLYGMLLDSTPWGVGLTPLVLGLSAFTIVTSAFAERRRRSFPATERTEVFATNGSSRPEIGERIDGKQLFLACLLLLSVAGVSGVSFFLAQSGDSASTSFYVLSENESGELTADGYPTELTYDQETPLHLGVENHAHEMRSYAIVVKLQQVRVTDDGSSGVLRSQRVANFSTPSLAAGERWENEKRIVPPMVGTRLRLVFLLYEESPPAEPSVRNAHRNLHYWVNVSAGPEVGSPGTARTLAVVDPKSR